MVWFFERGTEISTLEVRRRQSQFEVAVRNPDGVEEIEVIPTPHDLLTRLERLPSTLFADGWRPISGRLV